MKRFVALLFFIFVATNAFAGPPGKSDDVMYRDFRYAVVGKSGPAYSIDFTKSTEDRNGDLGSATVNRISGVWSADATGKLVLLRGDRTQYIQRTWQFDSTTAYWLATNADADTQNISAFGVSTATYLKCSGGNGSHWLKKNTNTFNGRYAWLTIYASKIDYNWIKIDILNNAETNGYRQYFDMDNGVFGTGIAVGAGALIRAYSDNTGLAAGEYRIGILVDLSAIYTSCDLYIYVAEADGDTTINDDGKGIYIYGAQLEALEGPEAIPLNAYTSDFSVGVDSFGVSSGGGVAGNIDGVGGQDDTLRFTLDGNNTTHIFLRTTTYSAICRIKYDYYIPSANSNLDGIRLHDGAANYLQATPQTTLDAWTTTSWMYATSAGTFLRFICYDGASITFQDVGADDVVYIKNIQMEYLQSPGGYADGWEPGPYTETSGATGTVPSNIQITEYGLPFQGGQMINRQIRTRVLNGANWTPTNITLGTGTGIDNKTSMNIKLTASANNGTLIADAATMPAAATNCTSAYFKRVTGTGAIYITDDNGANWTEVTGVTDSAWTRKFITRSQASVQQGFKLATSGDAVLVDFSEIIAGQAYPSLYGISLPDGDNTSPVGMTAETGSATNGYYNTMSAAFKAIYDTGGSGTTCLQLKMGFDESAVVNDNGIVSVGNSTNSLIDEFATQFRIWDGVFTSANVATPAFVYGDIIELCEIHETGGALRIGYSWNGAAWVWDTSSRSYDGAFALGTYLRWFWGNIYPTWVQKFDVYNQAYSTTWVESKY